MAKEFKLFCDVAQIKATVTVEGDSLSDNADAYVIAICAGCTHWSSSKLALTENALNEEYGSKSGINANREHVLEQKLVDMSRFREGESQIVVATCTPVDAE